MVVLEIEEGIDPPSLELIIPASTEIVQIQRDRLGGPYHARMSDRHCPR